MPDEYKIYLVNKSVDKQTFWCFLERPEELVNDPAVFANSDTYLTVRPNREGIDLFTIPVQYIVGAGASNNAVGLNIRITSSVSNDALLTQTWTADYATLPDREGPSMGLAGDAPADSIALVSNNFDKGENEAGGWYSSQSFGIQTDNGFIGMTWSPKPGQTRTLTPTLTFYVAAGTYGANKLASWDEVSNEAATITVPRDFSLQRECTVTYTGSGKWKVTPGAPKLLALAEDLDWFLSPAHSELVALAYLDSGKAQTDTLDSVHWDATAAADGGDTYLSGTVTVTTALTAAFGFFVLSGVQFRIERPESGVTSFRFSYSGTKSADAIKSLFKAGAKLVFGGAS